MIGKQITITKDSKAEEASAFYCDLCKCSLKDSTAWYDHINGKKHNRLKGMSMVVERVDVDRVRAKLESLKNKNAPVNTSLLGKRLREPTPELPQDMVDKAAEVKQEVE